MIEITVQIDDTRFRLAQEEDLPALQERFRQAVQGPAAFVTFEPLGYSTVSVLVSPTTKVRFDQVARSESVSDVDSCTVSEWEPEIDSVA
ncbi:hypothetical protein [Frondihabitans peucedani]|uniref:Uncharacterized protein n=1 Tax=Frondihabitans peucedani TaxID=598626 RepID=A0ABP8E6I1_9MICO